MSVSSVIRYGRLPNSGNNSHAYALALLWPRRETNVAAIRGHTLRVGAKDGHGSARPYRSVFAALFLSDAVLQVAYLWPPRGLGNAYCLLAPLTAGQVVHCAHGQGERNDTVRGVFRPSIKRKAVSFFGGGGCCSC